MTNEPKNPGRPSYRELPADKQKKLDEARASWTRKLKPASDAIRNSSRLDKEDYAVRINARGQH